MRLFSVSDLCLRWSMNSHKTPDELDELFRQALRPLGDAHPPRGAWRRLLRQICVMRPFWGHVLWGHVLFSWMRGLSAQFYLPPSTNQPCCVGHGGKCTPSPFLGVMVSQMVDLRMAS